MKLDKLTIEDYIEFKTQQNIQISPIDKWIWQNNLHTWIFFLWMFIVWLSFYFIFYNFLLWNEKKKQNTF